MTAVASIPLTSSPSAFGQGIRDLLDASVALARGIVPLTRAERAVAQALTLRMDWDEWCFPAQFDRTSWLSVARIGEEAGYGRRRACWALRQLEVKGLLEVDRRAPQCSAYKFVTKAWETLVGAHRVERSKLDRERMQARRDRWKKLLGTNGISADSDELGDVPAWAVRAAKHTARGEMTPEQVWRLVARVVSVVIGERNDPADLGAVAKPVVHCWEAAGRPSEDAFAGQIQTILDAATAHAPGKSIRRLWKGKKARSNRESIPYLLQPARFGRLWSETQAWLQTNAEPHPQQEAPAAELEEALPGELDLEGTGTLSWQATLDAAVEVARDTNDVQLDITLPIARMLEVEGEVDGLPVLRIASEGAAGLVRDHVWPLVKDLAHSVRLVWGHPRSIS